jgi:ElaB/YqjD/DUF883 family membrane-anchored ribosome-binding protein
MPNTKRGEGQNQNFGSAPGGRDQARPVGQQVQQGAEHVAGQVREGLDTARETAAHGYRQAEGAIARNPGPSVLVGFGVGFGLGLVLCSMFTHEETWAEKYLPDSLQNVPDRYQSLVASLKSLPRTVHDHLPSAVAKHLG